MTTDLDRIPDTMLAWPLYGAGLENLGVDGKPAHWPTRAPRPTRSWCAPTQWGSAIPMSRSSARAGATRASTAATWPAADRPGPRGHDDRGGGRRGVAGSFSSRPTLCTAGRYLLSWAQPGLRLRLHRRAGAIQPAGRSRAGRRRGMLRDPGARRAGLRGSRADRAVGVRRGRLRAAAAATRQGGRRAVDHRPAGAGGRVPAGRDADRHAAAKVVNRCPGRAARPDHLARAGAA